MQELKGRQYALSTVVSHPPWMNNIMNLAVACFQFGKLFSLSEIANDLIVEIKFIKSYISLLLDVFV